MIYLCSRYYFDIDASITDAEVTLPQPTHQQKNEKKKNKHLEYCTEYHF